MATTLSKVLSIYNGFTPRMVKAFAKYLLCGGPEPDYVVVTSQKENINKSTLKIIF